MNYLAASSSPAGITTAIASIFTAFALVVTALTGMVYARTAARKAAAAIAANAASQERAEAQLKAIHTLTNATLTTALQGELNATRRELVMWRALVLRDGETPEGTQAVAEVQNRVDGLTAQMADRARQAAEVARQAAQADRRE